MAWLTNYTYRKEITITGSAGGAQTDYTMELTVYRSSGADSGNAVYIGEKCETDFRDIRFTESDGDTLLSQWKEEHIHGSWAKIWVEFNSIAISPNTETFYMYYGYSSATDPSDDAATFLVGADFDDGNTTGLTLNTAGGGALTVPAITQLHSEIYVDDFIKFPSNPVLGKRVGKWDDTSTRDLAPVIAQADNTLVKESGKLVAFYMGSDGADDQIGRATSTDDGVTWGDRLDSPVIATGGGGDWWENLAQTGSCIKRTSDGLYMLAMSGKDGSNEHTIGVQTSVDLGLNWTDLGVKLDEGDFNHPDDPFDAMSIPWVIWDGSQYVMFFEGRDSTGRWKIYGATSSDFVGTWTPMNGGNPVFDHDSGGAWDNYAVANPKVVKLDTDKYVMSYNGRQSGTLWDVGFAYCTNDFTSWTRHGANPVIVKEGTGWEDESLECSAMVYDNSTYLRFWYQAFGTAPGFQIGFAKCRQGRILHGVSALVADGWVAGSMQANTFWTSILTKETTDPTISCSLTQLILIDFAAVPSPMANVDWNPQARFVVTRYTSASGQTHKFAIYYIDGGGTAHYWDGDSWEAGAQYLLGPGLYEIQMWDDDTNFKLDIIDWWTGVSALTAVASIAKASVKAFVDGRALVSAEQFTSHYYGGQYFDNAIVRKYVEAEPTWTAWGAAEAETQELTAAVVAVSSSVVNASVAVTRTTQVTVTIDGDSIVKRKGSLSIENRIEERSTAQFTVVDIAGTASYQRGQPVEIWDTPTNLIFAGFIDDPGKARIGATGSKLYHDITCIDNHYLADKRLVIKSYTDKTLEYIVEDILTDYLVAEGISEGEIQTGPIISSAVFNYVRVTDAFDALRELSGFTWFIDENKKLYFIARDTYAAPWNLDSVNYRPVKGSVHLNTGNPLYRNRQYIRGGKGLTSQQIEAFTGDGKVEAFTVGYPIAQVPAVEVNSVVQTVGIKVIDTGKHCYWSKGDATIVFDTAPGNNLVVDIVYYGEYPLMTVAVHPTEAATRAAIEGGTGIVEDMVTEAQHETAASMQASARAKIDFYTPDAERFTYQTRDHGLSPGQLQEITYSPFNFTAHEMLIEEVRVTDVGDDIIYSITAITGPSLGSWTKFFANMLSRQDKSIRVGDDLLLTLLIEANTLELTEVTSIDEDEFAVSGLVNRWLNSPPIDAGRICNIEHERIEMTEVKSLDTHLTEDYEWDDAGALWDFATWA